MKQKIAAAVAALAVSAGLLAVCAGNTQEQQVDGAADAAADKIEVVCATFPAYDWARQVVGDQAERYDITYLMEGGVDLHSYQPSVEDIAKIADADLFVYVSGESDEWAEDAVKTAGGDSLHALSMLEAVGDAALEEEVVEGMEADDHDHDHEAEMTKPADYLGKVVRMKGPYYHTHYEETDANYFYVIIEDATACCSQGIEFVWDDGSHAWPGEYPEDGAAAVVTGAFDTYAEGENVYAHLRDADFIAR